VPQETQTTKQSKQKKKKKKHRKKKKKQKKKKKKKPTGILSGYLSLMRADSACLLSGIGKNKMLNSGV